MTTDCTKENCIFCYKCEGDNLCFSQDSLPHHFIHHKCDHNCSLSRCPKCQLPKPLWYLNCHEGFCADCAVYLYYFFNEKLFPGFTNDAIYSDFMKKMRELYVSINN